MKLISCLVLFLTTSFAQIVAHAGDSVLRVACSGENADAEVYINGKFRGECPVDIQVSEGVLPLRVVKIVDAQHERVFEQNVRIGEGSIKKVEVILSEPQLNAAAQKIENKRLELVRMEAAKQEEKRWAQNRAELASALSMVRQQGAEVGNGKAFRDCPSCPAMVLVPSPGKDPVAIGQFEITRGQFSVFAKETRRASTKNCEVFERAGLITDARFMPDEGSNWASPGFKQTDDHPVVCVSWADAKEYVKWLSAKTGHNYQLLDANSWLGAAGGKLGQKVVLPWAEQGGACQYANLYDETAKGDVGAGLGKPWLCNDAQSYTSPVGSFKPNQWGIYDIFGNVNEWLEDAPKREVEGEKVVSAGFGVRLVRGGSWATSFSDWEYEIFRVDWEGLRQQTIGFRVMRYLTSLKQDELKNPNAVDDEADTEDEVDTEDQTGTAEN